MRRGRWRSRDSPPPCREDRPPHAVARPTLSRRHPGQRPPPPRAPTRSAPDTNSGSRDEASRAHLVRDDLEVMLRYLDLAPTHDEAPVAVAAGEFEHLQQRGDRGGVRRLVVVDLSAPGTEVADRAHHRRI